uniref:Gustatory receptor n=1 Tax=Tetranychus urticae TaxID=32264 RepID=T1L0Z0_TETUR
MVKMIQNSLTNYLTKFSLLNLDYLTAPSPKYYTFIRSFSILNLIVLNTKFIIFITVKLDHKTALNLGDYAIKWSKPHHFLLFVDILWLTCGLSTIYLLQRTNVWPKKQFWFKYLSILDADISDWTYGNKAFIINLFFCVLKSNLFLGAAFTWCLYIPVLSEVESIKQFFFISLNSFNGAITGYSCTALCVNLSFIFAFYSLSTGLKYDNLASRLKSQAAAPSDSKITNIINRELIQLLIENHKANYFWTQLNSIVFLCTFFALIPILFLIFFVPLTNFIKFSMIVLGALNFLCGQSITFLSGSFAKTKFDRCFKQLNRVLISRDDFNFNNRIQLICSADYLINRHLFYIFGGFEFSQISYLLVILEITSLLLLLIANAGLVDRH